MKERKKEKKKTKPPTNTIRDRSIPIVNLTTVKS